MSLCLASPVILSAAHKDLCCSICVDLFADPVILPCGHCFCKRCACKCLDRLPRCPLCKRSSTVRSVADVPVLSQLVHVCRQLATSCGVTDLALESQWSQQPLLKAAGASETPLATEAVPRPSDDFDDDAFASYGEKETQGSASAEEAEGVDLNMFQLTTQSVVSLDAPGVETPHRLESQAKRHRQCIARSGRLFPSDERESAPSLIGNSCTQIISNCGVQPSPTSSISNMDPERLSPASSSVSLDNGVELLMSCCLCHLSIYNRQSMRDFLRMILRQDPAVDQSSLQSVTEASLFELLGPLVGPFRLNARKKKKPRLEGGDDLLVGSGELAVKDEEEVFAHRQCLLWSPEVFETTPSSNDNNTPHSCLANAEKAMRRGKSLSCALCCDKGATLGCAVPSCRKSFHIPCANLSSDEVCILYDGSYRLLCGAHASLSSKYFQ